MTVFIDNIETNYKNPNQKLLDDIDKFPDEKRGYLKKLAKQFCIIEILIQPSFIFLGYLEMNILYKEWNDFENKNTFTQQLKI